MKSLLRNILCSRAMGKLICFIFSDNIPCVRYRGYRFVLRHHPDKAQISAWIFWGFYESAEIRLTETYFKGDYDVIELGTSSGILASHVLTKLKNKRYYGIEANATLKETWNANVSKFNRNGNAVGLMNIVVGKEDAMIDFAMETNSTESNIFTHGARAKSIQIKSARLSTIIHDLGIGEYTLFSDIEGAEIFFIFHDEPALARCKEMIIELHDVAIEENMITAQALSQKLLEKGFRLVAQDGQVGYFKRQE